MSSAVIAVIILGGVGCLVLIAYIAQSVESAKQERKRQVLALHDRARTCWNLVTELPSTFLPADIRQFLLNYLSDRYREILTLEPANSAAQTNLAAIAEMQNSPYSSAMDTPEPIFSDTITAKNTASQVKSLVNFFVNIHQDGSVEKNTALTFINQGKAIYSLINTDITQLMARQAEVSKNVRLALSHYEKCKKRLDPFQNKNQMTERIKFINERINALRAQVDADQKKQQQESELEPKKQKDEWNEFSDGSDWKIKHDYE